MKPAAVIAVFLIFSDMNELAFGSSMILAIEQEAPSGYRMIEGELPADLCRGPPRNKPRQPKPE
jgi:hypothetical protein